MRRILGFVFVLAVLLSLALSAAGAEPIKIGCNLEMTGGTAAYGQMAWEGLELIQELVKPEVLGRPVKLVVVDNKTDRVEAANATSRLIEKEKVVAIIGPMISGNMLAAGPIAEKYGIPIIGPSTTNPLTTQGKQYVFRACFIDPFQGTIAAKFAYNNLKARTAAIISDISQDYCVALGNFFAREFTRLGGKVVTTVYLRTGDQDFSAQLTAIKNSNPDLIYMPNYYQEIALAARQARDLGLKQPILSGDGADAPELIQIGGPAVEGLMHTAFWHEKAAVTELGKKYIEKYRAKYGKAPNAFGALAADSYLILLDAIKRANSVDPKKIRDAIEATSGLQVVTGPVTIENGDAIKPIVIRRVEKGEFQYLDIVQP
ncbi:MAG TPA: ABC transporter substrate-binding protein [Firmicutes bacterium]|nr:ABC transporter substrate-binding protein [Bacillota bacterium]